MERTTKSPWSIKQKQAVTTYLTQPDFKIPKKLLSKFGPHTTIYLMSLIEKSNFCWVQFTNQEMADTIRSSSNRVKTSKRHLKDAGLITIVGRGTPPRDWHSVDIDKLLDFVSDKEKEIRHGKN